MLRRLVALILAIHFAPLLMADPLTLHPENPRYLSLTDNPILLVTAGEHYGALLNLDFDFQKYFATLAADGLNLTRTFSGVYRESPGAFRIAQNTLAPPDDRFICPYPRSEDTGNRFDLDRWDPAYFERLHAFMRAADEHEIVVEFVLFCPFYEESMWALSPFNPINHRQSLPPLASPNDLWSLDRSGPFLAYQEALVRKLVTELNPYDRLYFEVCNEPYQRELPQEWHDHMAELIQKTEEKLPKRHLISWNVANHGDAFVVRDPHPAYSLFNFHYSTPPTDIDANWHLKKPIGDNETGFKGQEDRTYRREAWEFMLAGGALFNHLDYSFAAGKEGGDFAYPDHQPGGGSAALRRQLGALKRFLESCDFIRFSPAPGFVKNPLPKDVRVRVLANSGKQYALYATATGPDRRLRLEVDLPPGDYSIEWFDPAKPGVVRTEIIAANAGQSTALASPPFPEDLAVKITRR